jgi:hypothetical protein
VTGRDVKKSMDLCFFYCFHEWLFCKINR